MPKRVRRQTGVLPHTVTDATLGEYTTDYLEFSKGKIIFCIIDCFTDLLLLDYASRGNNATNRQLYQSNVEHLSYCTYICCVVTLLKLILFGYEHCGCNAIECECLSDTLTFVSLFISDCPKSFMNVLFVWNHHKSFHGFHIFKAVFVIFRSVKRMAGIAEEYNEWIVCGRESKDCISAFYVIGIAAEFVLALIVCVLTIGYSISK